MLRGSNAPPTIADQPGATENDPIIPGVTIVSSRDCGPTNRWEFTINSGEEDVAIHSLLDAVADLTEFGLFDGEGKTVYQKDGERFKSRRYGHHWTGKWNDLDRDSAFAQARKQAKYNCGIPDENGKPHWNTCGHINKTK